MREADEHARERIPGARTQGNAARLAAKAGLCEAYMVEGGLVFAGATGTCGLARILKMMPWNRAPATQRAEA